MNREQFTERLATAINGRTYQGKLTDYAAHSIERSKSNFPVTNLITYCQDMNLAIVMTDMATEDVFYPTSVIEVHNILNLLMQRYDIDNKLVYRKTAVHYTVPKSDDVAPLSIKTLLAVCEVIHCDLSFQSVR